MRKAVLVICIAAMLLVACGGGEATEAPLPTEVPLAPTVEQEVQQGTTPEAKPEAEQATVRFAIFDWDRPAYESLIEAFEEDNPDVKVQVVSANEVLEFGALIEIEFPDDASRRLASAADVFSLGGSRQDVQEGLIRDLTPFIDADPDLQPDDFYPNALETHQWDGGTWALPYALNYQLIFFNKDAFDGAGEPYPEVGWSWDAFVAKANALTVRDGGDVSQWGFVPAGPQDRTLVESQVGLVIDDSSDPPVPRLDQAEVIDAVRWYADLFLKDQVAPYFEPQEEESEGPSLSEQQVLIDKGQAAMWRDTDVLWWYRNQQGNVGAVPFPVDSPDAHTTPVSTQSLVMSSGTQQPEAAWRFLDFMSRQTVGSLAAGVQSLPARRSTAESGGFWDDTDAELAEALRYAIDHSYSPRYIAGHDAFSDALGAILSGDQAVEDALAAAQTEAEAEIQGDLAEQAEATPAPTVVVAAEEEAPVSADAVTIEFMPGLGSLNLEPYRDLADQFQEANPDLVVELKMIDLTSGAVPDLPSMAGTSDCFQWFPGFQDAQVRESILNLEPFLDADPAFGKDDFFPQVLKEFTWQGQVMGLPADITPYVVEYNKDLFDAAGVDYPTLDWTPDEFLAAAVATTQGEDETKQYGFVPQMYELNDILVLSTGLGANLVDENADPPAFTYNDPSVVEALRWYAGLTTEHGVKPILLADITKLAGASSLTLEREAMINEGRAAMWTSTGATAGVYGDRGDLNLGSAPLPAEPGTAGGSYSGASGYFISAETENPQACWLWITYLTSQPGAMQGLPARISVAESNEYRQQVGAERADVYLASIGDAEEATVSQLLAEEEWLGGAIYWLGQAYSQVIEGEASVEDALDAAQKLADDYRACVITAGDFSQETWQTCAQEVDPSLPAFLFAGQ
ncbi:MAG: extracellular solute-binding protein [Anaerolineae bacterium]|jgi:multiple sugar transport system substrate-binding protein